MIGWGDRLRSYNDVKQLFNATFRNENTSISKSTIHKTITRFEENDIKNRSKTRRAATATDSEKSLDVLQSFVKNPHIFTHKTAQKYQIDQKSVCKILKQNKFHLYKIHLMQELNEDRETSRVL